MGLHGARWGYGNSIKPLKTEVLWVVWFCVGLCETTAEGEKRSAV